jgi:hypothetical protein
MANKHPQIEDQEDGAERAGQHDRRPERMRAVLARKDLAAPDP